MLARQKGGTIMTKIRYGFTVVAVCVALLWAGIAGAQPGPPNPGPPGRVLAQCQANLDTCEASAFVPQTGQTLCWDPTQPTPPFIGVACDGSTGQDGDFQAGTPLPNPRFTDNGDGTVTDNLTGLVWLSFTNCFGTRTWTEALDDAKTLSNGTCSLTDTSIAGDWRLPNVKELQSLLHYRFTSIGRLLRSRAVRTARGASMSATAVRSSAISSRSPSVFPFATRDLVI